MVGFSFIPMARAFGLAATACFIAAPAHAQGPRPPVPGAPVVTIRAPLLARPATAGSRPVTVVAREELERPGRSAAEVLQSVPGVQVARRGAASDFATASLRGATAAQTPVYLAGIRLNDDVGGVADLSTLPLWILHRIEVHRGHAPGGADRMGIGGAIVLHPLLPRRTQLRAGAETGSYGQEALWSTASVRGERAGALVGVRLDRGTNDYEYEDDGGTRFDPTDDVERRRPNADFTSMDAWAIGTYRPGAGLRVQTVFEAFQRQQGASGLSLYPARTARTEQRRILAGVTVEGRCPWATAPEPGDREACRITSNTQGILGRSTTLDPRMELSALLSPRLVVGGERVGQRLAVGFRPVDPLEIQPAVDLSHQQVRLLLGEGEDLAGSRLSVRPSLSVTGEVPDGPTFRAVGVLECHRTTGDGPRVGGDRLGDGSREACDVLEPVARLGVDQEVVPDLKLMATVGRYVRLPTLGELFGTSPVVRGNARLAPETGISADLGARYEGLRSRHGRAALEGFLFHRWSENLVAFRQASLGIVRPYNVGATETLGAELAASGDLLQHLRFRSAVTYLDPRDRSADRQVDNDLLPYQSRLVVDVQGEVYTTFPRHHVQRAYASAGYLRRAARFADPAGLVVLPAQESVDVDVGVELRTEPGRPSSALHVRAGIRNLTDQRVSDLLGAPLPGRRFTLSLTGILPL